MKQMMKDTMVLLVITLISGLILGFIFQITKEPIKEQKEMAQANACLEVFENADHFNELNSEQLSQIPEEYLAQNGFEQMSIGKVLEAKDASETTLGFVLSVVSHKGYGGDIGFYMGIQLDGTLNGISILEIAETPGLGMKAEEVLKPQFDGKNVAMFSYTKSGASNESEIDAISGATITSSAVVDAVNGGMSYFANVLLNQKGGCN